MLSVALCALAFVAAVLAGRRSLVAGLVTVLGVGYVYGIMRANVLETGSHFIFDAAVIGLYCVQLSGRAPQALRVKTADLTFWIGLLAVYPLLLLLAPLQDLMIELVGLRGNIFLLPFLLLGARLKGSEMYTTRPVGRRVESGGWGAWGYPVLRRGRTVLSGQPGDGPPVPDSGLSRLHGVQDSVVLHGRSRLRGHHGRQSPAARGRLGAEAHGARGEPAAPSRRLRCPWSLFSWRRREVTRSCCSP